MIVGRRAGGLFAGQSAPRPCRTDAGGGVQYDGTRGRRHASGCATYFDPELVELLVLGSCIGAPVIKSSPTWLFGKRLRVADPRLVEQRHQQAVDARGDAAVRRRAHGERVEQEAELLAAAPRGRCPRYSNTCCCSSGSWIRKEPPASSLPLPTRSYATARALLGSVAKRSSVSSVGRVNGWCAACQVPRRLVVLGGRHVDDPEELPAALVDQVELAAELVAEQAEHLLDDALLVGDEEQRVAGLPRSCSSSSSERNLAIGEETSPSARKTM